MKQFIVVDGVTYINEAMLTDNNAFAKVVYTGTSRSGESKYAPVQLSLQGSDFTLEVKEGRFAIKDRNGVERISGKFYD